MVFFTRRCSVFLVAMLMVAGATWVRADTEPESPQSESGPVTQEMRVRILERLLAVAQDEGQPIDVRVAAIRSVRIHADVNRSQARNGILKIAGNKNAPVKVRIVAQGTLLRGGFRLSEAQEKKVSADLWKMLAEPSGDDDKSRRLRTLAGYILLKVDAPPTNAAAARTLLAMMNRDERFFYNEMATDVSTSMIAQRLLREFPKSADGLQALIGVLGDLKVNEAGETPQEETERHRQRLIALIGQASPETKGVAEILLEATKHESPAVREAAIKALGNE